MICQRATLPARGDKCPDQFQPDAMQCPCSVALQSEGVLPFWRNYCKGGESFGCSVRLGKAKGKGLVRTDSCLKRVRGCVQVYEPIDYLHLYGEDPVFPQGGGAKLYVATGDSSQGMLLSSFPLQCSLYGAWRKSPASPVAASLESVLDSSS